MLNLVVSKDIINDLKKIGDSLARDYLVELHFKTIVGAKPKATDKEVEFISNSLEDLLRQFADHLRENPLEK